MLKKRFMKHSLYVTLGTIIIATVTLVMLLNLTINHIQISERLTAELEADAHQTASHLTQNIAPFMESYAVEEYRHLVENETQHKDLLAIIVSDQKMAAITGTNNFKTGLIQNRLGTFSEYDPDNKDHSDILKNSYFTDQHPIISANGDTIGSLTMYVSDQKIHQALEELLFSSLINMLIISFTLTLLLFMAIRHFLLAPLSKTISLIEQTDESGIPIQEIKVSGPTEMTKLSQTINTMLQTIKDSKEALAESEFRWKFAVDGRGDGLWDWNVTDKSCYYSPQCKALLGLSPETPDDLLYDWEALTYPDDRAKLTAAVQKHLKGETPIFDCEYRVFTQKKQIVWIHNRGMVVERSKTGEPLRMIGTISDIDDRIQAQNELNKAYRINKLIIETIPDLLWLKDNQGRYLLCNSKFEQFFGAKSEVIKGKTDYDFVDHELAAFFRKHDLHAMQAGRTVRNEERLTFAENGYQGLFETTKVPLVSDEGQVIGILGIGHDITESDRLIHRLDETKQLLLSLVNAIPFFIYRIDLNGRLTFVNKALAAYLNQSAEELVGHDFYQTVPNEWAKNYKQEDEQLIQTRKIFHKTKSLSNAELNTDEQQYFEIIKLPIYDFNQQIVGIQGIFWDVTENIQSKKALEHSAKHDSLTGLPNRYLFNELIQNVMHRCDRNNHIMALLFLDLDGFKEVNDMLGHEAGDEVLKNVADPLKAVLIRKEDIVARLGGDEFVIAIADLHSKQELIPVLNRLLTDLRQTLPYEKDGVKGQLKVTASIGVTIYPQQIPVGPDHLLRQADEAMYHAKNTGRNRYFFYDDLPKQTTETPQPPSPDQSA